MPASIGDARDVCSIPGWGRCPGVGNVNPLQYSCLESSTEDPGGLQSMGLQRVRHDLVTELAYINIYVCMCTCAYIHIHRYSILIVC